MKKNVLLIVGGAGCVVVSAGGCIVALLVGTILSLPLEYRLNPNLWYELPGEPFADHEFPCIEEWREGESENIMVCEELPRPPSVATNTPTKVTVYLEDDGTIVRYVHLEFTSFSSRMRQTAEDTYALLSWAEIIAEDIDLQDCRPLYVPYYGSGAWDCNDLVYAYTSVDVIKEPGDPIANLWIGSSMEDLDEHFHRQGLRELRRRYELTHNRAIDLMENEDLFGLDAALVESYFLLNQIPHQERTSMERQLMEEIADKRRTIGPQAQGFRKHQGVPRPIPSFEEGFLHITALVGESEETLQTLLGQAKRCEDRTRGRQCDFGDEFWTATITFDQGRSTQVTFRMPSSDVDFGEYSLRYFDLPVSSPDIKTEEELRWEEYFGLAHVSFQRRDDGMLDYVTVMAGR